MIRRSERFSVTRLRLCYKQTRRKLNTKWAKMAIRVSGILNENRTYLQGKSISLFPFCMGVRPPGCSPLPLPPSSLQVLWYQYYCVDSRWPLTIAEHWRYVHIIITVRFLSSVWMPFNLQIPSLGYLSILHWILRLASFRLSVCQQKEPLDRLILPSTSLLLMNDRAIEPMTNRKEFLRHSVISYIRIIILDYWIGLKLITLIQIPFFYVIEYFYWYDDIVYQFDWFHNFSFAFIRALQAGVKSPLLVLLPDDRFENVELVTLLGALEALYVVSSIPRIIYHNTNAWK